MVAAGVSSSGMTAAVKGMMATTAAAEAFRSFRCLVIRWPEALLVSETAGTVAASEEVESTGICRSVFSWFGPEQAYWPRNGCLLRP